MKATDFDQDRYGVVIVDANKFLQLWRDEPHSIHGAVARGNPATWSHDEKYPKANGLFSRSTTSPVSLAKISYNDGLRSVVTHKFLWFGRSVRQETFGYLGFTDGITRTIWLLANQCAAFPIACELPGACRLHHVAGVPGAAALYAGRESLEAALSS